MRVSVARNNKIILLSSHHEWLDQIISRYGDVKYQVEQKVKIKDTVRSYKKGK